MTEMLDRRITAAPVHALPWRHRADSPGGVIARVDPSTDAAPVALLAVRDPQTAELVEFVLQTEGLRVVTVTDGMKARRVWSQGGIDVVVLDTDLPADAGLTLCREMRSAGRLPIVLLTEEGAPWEEVDGFEAGADDCVSKPLKPRLLALRVKALLRRSMPVADGPTSVGDLKIDALTRTVHVRGRSVALSNSEWRLLAALTARPGETLSWRRLLTAVWDADEWVGGRALVKAAIYRLRQRLQDDSARPRYIETVRGVGYRIVL